MSQPTCVNCRHFVMSRLAASMSGGRRGYCLEWTARRAHVVVADTEHRCSLHRKRRLPIATRLRAVPRVLWLRASGKWVFTSGPPDINSGP